MYSYFTGSSEKNVKEVSGNGASLTLYCGLARRTWDRGGSFTGDSKRHVKEGFGSGMSLSL
jgi:hypothetical protein